MATDSDARILIGGKRAGFQGAVPGLVEEALLTLGQNKPLYLVGGFGGVTLDVIRAMHVDSGDWLPRFAAQAEVDTRLEVALAKLEQIVTQDRWKLNNGLTDDENKKLAAAWRPSEIAALISLGMGRRFAE